MRQFGFVRPFNGNRSKSRFKLASAPICAVISWRKFQIWRFFLNGSEGHWKHCGGRAAYCPPWCRLWSGAVTAHTLVGVNTNGERVWLNSPDTDKTSEQKCSELTIIYQFCTNSVISAENIYYKINHELQKATSSSTVVFNLFCSIAPLQEVCFEIAPHLWF